MFITVSDIPLTGRNYEFDIKDMDDIGLKILETVHFSGTLFKSDEDIRMLANVKTCLEMECTRCLALFPYKINSDVELFYRPYRACCDRQEHTLEELGVLHYSDNTIDITSVSRDTVILEIPMRVLCNEDCKGLCVKCGQNLNLKDCGCQVEEQVSSPFQEFFQKRNKK
mgnify:CR=1 FL=1